MGAPGFKQYNVTEYDLGQVQTNVANAFTPLYAPPWVGGTLVNATLKAAASTSVNHGLGRQAQGWLLLSTNKPGEVYLSSDKNSSPTKTLLLATNATDDTAVTLWIF